MNVAWATCPDCGRRLRDVLAAPSDTGWRCGTKAAKQCAHDAKKRAEWAARLEDIIFLAAHGRPAEEVAHRVGYSTWRNLRDALLKRGEVDVWEQLLANNARAEMRGGIPAGRLLVAS